MVKLTLALVSILSFATVGLSASVQRSVDTVDQIKADVSEISAKLTSLGTSVNNFPTIGGTLAAALAVHTGAQALAVSLAKGGADVTSTGTIGASDGTAILASIQALSALIQSALTGIVNKKAAFSGLGVGGVPILILLDLKSLKGNTTVFANALITNNVASLIPTATALRDKILPLFDPAIAAYSS